MRNNLDCVTLLQYAAHFMRNVVVLLPSLPRAAIDAVTVVITGMEKYSENAEFQREACSLLWAISALSSEGKIKILDVDGAQALNNVLLQYRGVEIIETAALGAFKEIAL